MADLVGAGNWGKFKNLIRSAHDTFFQEDIIWKRSHEVVTEFNEDNRVEHLSINIKGLMAFNSFKSWPSTKKYITGEIDDTNAVLLLNKEYLGENGWLNDKGYFDFNPALDYFIHMGILYKAEGDTPVSQAFDEPLLFHIVLKRQETPTGDTKYEADNS